MQKLENGNSGNSQFIVVDDVDHSNSVPTTVADDGNNAAEQSGNTNCSNVQNQPSKPAANTKKCIAWAVNTFYSWRDRRIGEISPEDLPKEWTVDLREMSDEQLCDQLTYFFSEARRGDGTRYNGRSLVQMADYLHMYLKDSGRFFSWRTSPKFASVRNAIHESSQSIIAAEQPGPSSLSSAADLDLGRSNGRQLLRTLVYKIGTQTGCKAGNEHRNFEFANFEYVNADSEQRVLRITLPCNKNKTKSKEIKLVDVLPTEPVEESLMSLYDFYLEKIPQAVRQKPWFYCRPLSVPTKTGCWFAEQPVGVHSLETMVRELFHNKGHHLHENGEKRRPTSKTDDDEVPTVTSTIVAIKKPCVIDSDASSTLPRNQHFVPSAQISASAATILAQLGDLKQFSEFDLVFNEKGFSIKVKR